MNDETNSNGNGGAGSGGGGDSFEVGGTGPDDATVVIVSDEYTSRAIGKLDGGLRGAADRCGRFVAVGSEAGSEREAIAVLEELEEDLQELEMHVAGAKRAVARHRRERAAALAKKTKTTKETP